MKKFMILSLAVLGMVLGSIAVVQPVKASGPCTESITDRWGCTIRVCGDCIWTSCPGGTVPPTCGPTIV